MSEIEIVAEMLREHGLEVDVHSQDMVVGTGDGWTLSYRIEGTMLIPTLKCDYMHFDLADPNGLDDVYEHFNWCIGRQCSGCDRGS